MKRLRKTKPFPIFFLNRKKKILSGIAIPVTTSRLHLLLLLFFSPPTFYFNFIYYKWTRNK